MTVDDLISLPEVETVVSVEPPSAWMLAPGVVLPAMTIALEASTHACAEAFFDPIPTPAHLVLASAVPLVNLFAWLRLHRGLAEPRSLGWMLGASAGIAALYALLFLPLLPLALIAVMFGVGLLPLAPYVSLVVAGLLARRLGTWRFFRWGLAMGVALMLLLEAPGFITERGMSLASMPDAGDQKRGMALLRTFGSRDYILNRCYWQNGRARLFAWIPGADAASPQAARKIYYRLTGDSFESAPATRANAWAVRTLDWDPDAGGVVVGQRLKGLEMAESRIDGTVDARAGIGYLEWTLVFRNSNDSAHEARTQVQLPPGAAVSRVTLWINGEEREAAFGTRGQVRAAYQRVVQARRDPLLVTTSGPDRVLVQCFPVPARGEMKVRLGVTAPLYQRTKLLLPALAERNFRIGEKTRHAVWLESEGQMRAAGFDASREGEVFRLRGQALELPVVDLLGGSADPVWTRDERQAGYVVGRQVWRSGTAPRRVAVVVDGSAGMEAHRAVIARALSKLKGEVRLFVSSDVEVSSEMSEFRGGVDAVPALVAAHEAGMEAIVWIHGRQPEAFTPWSALLQHRQRARTPMYLIAAQPGENRVAQALDGLAVSVPRTGTLEQDLDRLFREWNGGWRWELERRDTEPQGTATSQHLARLWALSEVGRLIGLRQNEEAARLAALYQLVTPVSGAVVLETVQQYKDAGLDPASSSTVPTVPEPETWVLMALTAAVLLIARRRAWLQRS